VPISGVITASTIANFAGDGSRRAFVDCTFDFLRIGCIDIYPGALPRFENAGKSPKAVSRVLTNIGVPIDRNLAIAVASLQFDPYYTNDKAQLIKPSVRTQGMR
jgi:hypothetical protein